MSSMSLKEKDAKIDNVVAFYWYAVTIMKQRKQFLIRVLSFTNPRKLLISEKK